MDSHASGSDEHWRNNVKVVKNQVHDRWALLNDKSGRKVAPIDRKNQQVEIEHRNNVQLQELLEPMLNLHGSRWSTKMDDP